MGAMLAESGDFQKALSYNEEAVHLFEEAGDRNMQAIGRNNIGGVLDILGDAHKALESYREALELHPGDGARTEEAHALNNIGEFGWGFGEWEAPLGNDKQALPPV